MSIYNVSGSALSACYDDSGDGLAVAYDINGTQVFSSGYSINNVVSYYREPTLDVCDDVNELSDDWQTFVHITDPHGSGDNQHSQAIAMYVLDNTPANFLVLGGDYVNWYWEKSQWDTYVAPFIENGFDDRVLAVLGNHELIYNIDGIVTGDGAEAKQAIYDDFLKDKSYLIGNTARTYYYFDDTIRKIRYMFINTSDVPDGSTSGAIGMTDAQLAWIAEYVVMPDSSWSLLVIGHVTLNTMGGITYSNIDRGIASTIAQNCNGSIIGYICGHQHIDLLYNDGNMEHATLMCDLFSNTNYYDGISVTDRVAGTVSEQAVSVISFNTKTKDVVIRRIGAGRQSTFSYNYA